MENVHHQLVKRIAKLVQQNKELSQELKDLRVKYEDLLDKSEEYEKIADKISHQKLSAEEAAERQAALKFNMVTVLYADFHGFRELIPEENPDNLIDQLDSFYMKFDDIISAHPIEKIKTIGDSYMCAGGIPNKNITNPIEVVLAGHQMLHHVRQANEATGRTWEIRLAIHTGPVTAFASGKHKISYDIKGDTVNIASRMESSGQNGQLFISVMTYELVKEFFECEYYGKLPVKYKGNLDIYNVKGILPELSVNGEGIEPNEMFKTKFALIQFHDLQEVVLDILEKDLPSDLYYHNLKHTVDVVTEVELIGWAEGISDEDILILKTAALFHDIGHTISYDDHEYYGTEVARQILPKFNYAPEEIEKICQIIQSTKLPPQPKNILEEIICDADLDYLGRIDFIPVSNTLFEELHVRNKITSMNDWNKMQIKFISSHQYFTQTARKLREVNKQIQIERIRSLLTGE
ncbi:MAG TPA: adenylate/guanylate cyclase domain-containing protein [Bacteroidales bacterium]|nr:adenylate/guanylate cyclase domain-containing protein [Bacteroidales bacterium]